MFFKNYLLEEEEDGPWKAAYCICRICGYEFVSVYPADILDEDRQECPNCRHFTCGPDE